MTDSAPNPSHSDWPDLPISLLQGPDEPDIPYAQRVYRAGWDAAMAAITCPHIRQGDSGSNWCDLAQQGAPHPSAITGRPPREDECDAEGWVWVWEPVGFMEQPAPAWVPWHRDDVTALLKTESECGGTYLGRRLRWRPAASLPVEVES